MNKAPEQFLDETKALACIHCGLCLSSCPTYLETGNENDSPRGRIYLMRAVQDGRLALEDAAVRHIDLCLGCRACEAVCPSGVQYGTLLEETRDHIEKNYSRTAFQTILRRFVIEQIFPYPWRMKLALWPARLVKKADAVHLLPKFAREAMALIPDGAEEAHLPEISPAIGGRRGTVGFISGCVMSVMFGPTHDQSVRLLNLAGYDVVTPPAQGCCGALYAHSGKLDQARAAARENIAVFSRTKLDAIIINAAGCGSTLKEYGHLLHDDPAWAERGAQFSAQVKDLTEWLATPDFLVRLREAASNAPDTGKVTYHDACHLAHPQRITKQPRDLVKAIAGARFVELPEADVCCGSAGSYNLTEPEMAARLQQRKIQNILKTGARTLVTTNPGCLLQIQAGVRAAGAEIEVLHVAEYLERVMEAPNSKLKVQN